MEAAKRLYPTQREERLGREMKEKFGLKDAVIIREPSKPTREPSKEPDTAQRATRRR